MIQRQGYSLRNVLPLLGIALLGHSLALAQTARGVRVLSATAQELRLEVAPTSSYIKLSGGEILPRISSATVINSSHPGEPVHLRISIPVALPSPEGNVLEVVSAEYEVPVQGRLAPVPSIGFDAKGMQSESFTVDPAAYANTRPTLPVAALRYLGIARDVHSGTIDIEPYQYDPASNSIRFLRSVTLRLRYASAPVATGRREGLSELTRAAYVNARAAGNWTMPSGATPAFNRRSATSSARAWLRVTVKEDGLYALTSDDFKKAGIEISTLDAGRIAIYGGDGADMPEKVSMADSNRMHQVPTIIDRDGSGRVSQVLFYGSGPMRWRYQPGDTVPIHALSPFVSANSYIVAIDGDASTGFTDQTVPNGTPSVFPASAYSSLAYDEDKVNVISTDYISGSGRGWFNTQFIADGSAADTRPFPTHLAGLDRSLPVQYRVRLAHSGKNSCNSCYDGNGTFTVMQDQTQLGSPIVIGSRTAEETVALAASRLFVGDANAIPGDNTSMVRIAYQSKVQAKGFLDYIEIHYGRRLALESSDNDQISFESPSGSGIAEYHVSGFSGDDLIGFDITDPANPILLASNSTSGGTYVFRDMLRPTGGSHRYFITRRGTTKRVVDVVGAEFGDLRSRMLNADILVITHADFKEAAQKYVDYRNAQKRFSAAYVTTEQIYTEFSHGNLDPTAMRDYISYAFKNWALKPSYVLLMGDGTYDYRNLVSQQKQFVPTYETEDGDLYNTISSAGFDDYFVRVVGNDPLLDLSVGRLPVETADQADVVVDKVKRYESTANSGTWRQTIILAADDAYPTGGGDDFVRQSEELWRQLPTWLEPKKIYLPAYPTLTTATGTKPGAEQDLLDFINRGAIVTNWVGHGNPDVWAHETILQKDQFIPRLFNDSMLTYITAVTCNFGHFDNPNKVSGGEMFVRNPSGAIAVMTASRAVWISANEYLMDKYMEQLFRRDSITHRFPTIGQALFAVKQISNSDNDEKYMVFGDPALYLDLPGDSVVIDRINTMPVATDTATVAALSVVTVEGRIADQLGSVDQSFNGTAIVSLYDADHYESVIDNGSPQNMKFYGGRLFRGPATVTNGRFTATFRVPKDIAYDSATARLHVYAFNPQQDAAGSTTHIRVYGSDTARITDTHGPVINIFLDDRSFRSGDVVTPTPLLIVDLADSSGINSSGSGLGHHIEFFLDGAATSIDLSENYQTEPTDYGKGSAERKLLTLSPGEHQLRVRAWDIFNNPAEGTVDFRVSDAVEGALQVSEVVNYPNPMSKETDFTFRHNQSGSLDVEVGIYTLSGRKLRQLEEHGVTGRFVRLHWDGRDADGEVLANGVYLYRLKVTATGSATTGGEQEPGSSTSVFETIEKLAIER